MEKMQDEDLHTRSYAGVAEKIVKQQLKRKEVKIDVRKFGKYAEKKRK